MIRYLSLFLILCTTLFSESDQSEMFNDFQPAFKRMLWSLVSLLALVGISFWMIKRLLRKRSYAEHDLRRIKVLEKKVLSQKTMLFLIEVDSEKVLVSESQVQVQSLHSPEKTETVLRQFSKESSENS